MSACSHLRYIIFLASAKFVYGSDVKLVTDASEEYSEYVKAIDTLMHIFYRLIIELPLYKLYNNKLSRDFIKATKVSSRLVFGAHCTKNDQFLTFTIHFQSTNIKQKAQEARSNTYVVLDLCLCPLAVQDCRASAFTISINP